ncbi:hypothetical protein RIR_jg12548.t1 [Rhizophagus irregularis DAOM 181602=DAOM 197198]|nr:hypothetical protein RIR_jg12548.t1 [Rhizophagus irregularis DAOM 181602=DAOM 197198]
MGSANISSFSQSHLSKIAQKTYLLHLKNILAGQELFFCDNALPIRYIKKFYRFISTSYPIFRESENSVNTSSSPSDNNLGLEYC